MDQLLDQEPNTLDSYYCCCETDYLEKEITLNGGRAVPIDLGISPIESSGIYF